MSAIAAIVRSRPWIADLPRVQLMRIAVARGCRHYHPLLPADVTPTDVAGLPHEVLGAALLRGPADANTFRAIRCGAMVLSDLGNSPARIAEASEFFGVTHRVAHLARLGLEFDQHPNYWRSVLETLPLAGGEEDFLRGVSRLTTETRLGGPNQKPVRIWLRTHYHEHG
jgi:hypothetical protein